MRGDTGVNRALILNSTFGSYQVIIFTINKKEGKTEVKYKHGQKKSAKCLRYEKQLKMEKTKAKANM